MLKCFADCTWIKDKSLQIVFMPIISGGELKGGKAAPVQYDVTQKNVACIMICNTAFSILKNALIPMDIYDYDTLTQACTVYVRWRASQALYYMKRAAFQK